MENRLCYEATDIHLSHSGDGAFVLLIETPKEQAHLSVLLSAEVMQSLRMHIAVAFPSRPNQSEPV